MLRARVFAAAAVSVTALAMGAFGSAASASAVVRGPIAVAGVTPDATCPAWEWQEGDGPPGYTEVKMVSNSCDSGIQDRSWCELNDGKSGYWATSEMVWQTGKSAKGACGSGSYVTRGEKRTYIADIGSWSSWATFWS